MTAPGALFHLLLMNYFGSNNQPPGLIPGPGRYWAPEEWKYAHYATARFHRCLVSFMLCQVKMLSWDAMLAHGRPLHWNDQ